MLTSVLFVGMSLSMAWAYNRRTHAAVWFWLVILSGLVAAVVTAVPFALVKFFPRAAAMTEADVFRPVARPPSRLLGPAIGWPAFSVGAVLVAALTWFILSGWSVWHGDRSTAVIALLIGAVSLVRVARPWGGAHPELSGEAIWAIGSQFSYSWR